MSHSNSNSPVDLAPLSLLYHENSKLTAATLAYAGEAIAAFQDDPDQRLGHEKTYASLQRVDLKSVRRRPDPKMTLSATLSARRSGRACGSEPLMLETIASLLSHSAGVTGRLMATGGPSHLSQSVRAVPSGGALYPVEVYLAARNVQGLDPALYHFHPTQEALESVPCSSLQACWESIVWPANLVAEAAALLVLTGRWSRTLAKYGERGYRLVLLEAGHCAQNFLLVATALGVVSCPLAGFQDNTLAASLLLDPYEEPPLYAIALGSRSSTSK